MTDETHQAIELYKSLEPQHRETDRRILGAFLDQNVAVDSIRYGEFRGVHRGAARSVDGTRYYFHALPDATPRIMAADTAQKSAEVDRIMRGCKLGCDLSKAQTDEDEDDKKGLDGVGSLPPASMKEDQAIQQRQSDVTDVHPGATVSQTPQSDESTARWHGPTAKSASAVATELLRSMTATMPAPPTAQLEPLEQRFAREVMGKSLSGRLPPTQRANFSRWSAKQLRTSVNALEKWVRRG